MVSPIFNVHLMKLNTPFFGNSKQNTAKNAALCAKHFAVMKNYSDLNCEGCLVKKSIFGSRNLSL